MQVINEGIDELYTVSHKAMPNEQAQGELTLQTGVRNYGLETDLVQIRWPLIDNDNSHFIYEYPGDWNDLLVDDPERDDTGLPLFGTIRAINSQLYLDRAPTAAENGNVYFYQYDRDLVLASSTSEVPFKDAVFRAMVPAWVQLFKRERRNEFDGELYKLSIGRASRLLTQNQPRTHWSPR